MKNLDYSLRLQEHIEVLKSCHSLEGPLEALVQDCINALRRGGKILFCGNGGSAADAQHLASELTGSFQHKRGGLPALALTTDSSALTSIANDFGFEFIYSRQLEAMHSPEDVFIGISTSGNSGNVVQAVKKALELDIKTWAFLGAGGGALKNCLPETHLLIESNNTARVQEAHIFLGHCLCEAIDEEFSK